MKTRIFSLFVALMSIFSSASTTNAQIVQQCGHDHVTTQWWAQNPKSRHDYELSVKKIKASIFSKTEFNHVGKRNARITIPVVFHILHLNGPENISDAQIIDQIRILNRDYQKQNADTSQIVAAFKDKIGDVGFEFQLAGIDPNGSCTNGIIRHYTPKTTWNSSRLEDFTYTWPADKYLNIYIVKKIDIAPAYTFLPGIGIPDYADAIVCESWLVGSIGTATSQNSRVLTHEVGHWFGLPHIWGVSNAPGVECGDDFVDDTPITKGFVSCSVNNTKVCSPEIQENVQNYMDYAPCKLMFTNGQSDYMRETISLGLNKRDHLVSDENLRATGIIGDKPCSVKADFYSLHSSICKGESIQFYSQSQTGDTNGTLRWVIDGGSPAISYDTIVDVAFAEAGEYVVKLIVSGLNGTDSLTKVIHVYDGNNGRKAPQSYSFDDDVVPAEIQRFNQDPNGVQWQTLAGTGAEQTVGCFFLQNASTNSTGTKAYFETPFFDFSDNNKPSMSFYYSYAKNSDTQADTFRLKYTMDCGKTWRIFPGIPSTNNMAIKTGGVTSLPYFPSSSEQWKKHNLASSFQVLFKNKPSVKFRFLFAGDSNASGVNNFFIDEININNDAISGLQDQFEQNINIYPNPSTANFIIELQGTDVNNYCIELRNFAGQYIYDVTPETVSGDKIRFVINDNNQLAEGLYSVKIKKAGYPDIVKKVVIIK